MKLEIEHDDPRFCDECPVIGEFDGEPGWCQMQYWKRVSDVSGYYNRDTDEVRKEVPEGFTRTIAGFRNVPDGLGMAEAGWLSVLIRPKQCITENGE